MCVTETRERGRTVNVIPFKDSDVHQQQRGHEWEVLGRGLEVVDSGS